MEKSNSGMHDHGMPIETKEVPNMRVKKNGTEIPTKGTTTRTIHESKTFPFVILEETKSNDDKEETNFMIGLAGQLICEKKFQTMISAETYISRKPWDLIMGFVCTTIELMKKDNEKSK